VVTTVQGLGVELAVTERGSGPAVVMVHGMADDAAGWAPLAESLAGEARAIAYDRRGYGASGAPEPYGSTTVPEQAEDAAALVRGLEAAPALLCGRDLGALVCLDVAKRHRALVRGLVLIDPPLYAFSPAATEALAGERVALERWLRDDGPAGAVERWLGTRGGAGADRVARARARPVAFFADYAALATWPVTRAELRALDVPTPLVESPAAPPHLDAAVQALADLLPDADRVPAADVAGAIHALLARTAG
jgi:pimeloyl-ACP methyl ester carboxylesterase